ncbi:hypothetical protein [Microbacterium sp. nov. GSS16]|nr:hypothetical protein [Microbacterium sp. nov. GSS16]WCD91695.1 hypothetical protein PGB26_08320 [Microbacterium sp. nov. GSS16]
MLDAAFLSHVVLWVIGAIAVCGVVSSFAAMFSMGRSGYRED